jgi:hypothetical protein
LNVLPATRTPSSASCSPIASTGKVTRASRRSQSSSGRKPPSAARVLLWYVGFFEAYSNGNIDLFGDPLSAAARTAAPARSEIGRVIAASFN